MIPCLLVFCFHPADGLTAFAVTAVAVRRLYTGAVRSIPHLCDFALMSTVLPSGPPILPEWIADSAEFRNVSSFQLRTMFSLRLYTSLLRVYFRPLTNHC